jgi:probable HAF family extracellular repeat protein
MNASRAACLLVIRLIAVCTLALPGLAPAVAGPPAPTTPQTGAYAITDLGTLGGTYSIAYGVNNRGQVTGWSYTAGGASHAFLWQPGASAMTDLGLLGGTASAAYAISQGGSVVGYSVHAFLLQNGRLKLLPDNVNSVAGIGDAGQVVGRFTSPDGRLHAFRWQAGSLDDLGTLGGAPLDSSSAAAVNGLGQVVGASTDVNAGVNGHATLWNGGSKTDLGTFAPDAYSMARAINGAGQIVGDSYNDAPGLYTTPFLWTAAGGLTELPRPFAYPYGNALDINNFGQVVGDAGDTSYRTAVLWDGGTLIALQDLIPAGSGWQLNAAMSINDLGQIVGYGRIGSETHAFLLTPAPGGGSCLAARCLYGSVLDGDQAWDKHADLLAGVRVELRQNGVTAAGPQATQGGAYRFTGLAAGTYQVRVTLADAAHTPELFELRYSDAMTEALWAEVTVTLAAGDDNVRQDVVFTTGSRTAITDSNVSALNRVRLSAVAAIAYRARQYVDWLTGVLGASLNTAGRPAPVEIYTFSRCPDSDSAFYIDNRAIPDPACNTGTRTTEIYVGTIASAYPARQGENNSGPENQEWHELTHHLFATAVSETYCPGDTNHEGYDNPTTCDSLNEGLAEFMGAFFWTVAEGGDDSQYDHMTGADLESDNWEAWTAEQNGTGEHAAAEDLAVAALLWDLTDTHVDAESTQVIGRSNLHVGVVYTDTLELDIRTLWSVISDAHPTTVAALRDALFASPLVPAAYKTVSLDLDANGISDVAPLDVPFLMHGFYPVLLAEQGTDHHHYDVEIAVKLGLPGTARNRAVGRTDHHDNGSGGVIPRFSTPYLPHSYLGLTALGAGGAPLPGATAVLTLTYPELIVSVTQPFTAAVDSLLYFELPPYYRGYRAPGQPLPPCSTLRDYVVTVTLRATWQGLTSPDVYQFTNCEWIQALDAATGDYALAYTFTFPGVTTVLLPATLR